MSSAGGDMRATITINGNAVGGQDALMSVSEALKLLQTNFVAGANAAQGFGDALPTAQIKAYADSLTLATETSQTLADAGAALGPQFAEQAAQFLNAATSAEDYAARLDLVQAQIAAVGDRAEANTGLMAGFTESISGAFDPLVGFIQQAGQFVTALAAWSIIQDVIGWVQNLSSELFNLEVQTEKAINGWQYLFGSKAAATQLATWTSKFSLGIPFTRQDLLTATTTMGAAGMTQAQVEQFMPYLSDIAATYGSAAYGGRGTTLAQSAQAVRMFREGMSRMLKYDLNISPEQLIPYGLVGTGTSTGFHVTDPNSVFRALENFAKAKHLVGASQQMTQTTWWGGFSSAQDQIQNLLLSMGGTDLSGNIRQGSFFASLKQDLFGLLDWFNAHQSQLTQFADTMSKLVGTVVDAGGGMLGQFFTWLGRISNFQDTMGWISSVSNDIQTMFIGTPDTHPAATPPPAHLKRDKHGNVINLGHTSHGPGGAGGRTAPGAHGATGPTGFDWQDIPIFGGLVGNIKVGDILQKLSEINWEPIAKGLGAVANGFGQLIAGFQATIGPQVETTLSGLLDIFIELINLNLTGLGTALTGVGNGMAALGKAIQQAQPYFDPMTRSMRDFVNVLEQLIATANSGDWGKVWDILGNLFGGGGGGGGGNRGGGGNWWTGGLIPPGAFSSFGHVG